MLKVKIIAHTPEPDKVVAQAGKLCYSAVGVDEITQKLTEEEIKTKCGLKEQNIKYFRNRFQLYNNFEEHRPRLLEDTSLYEAVLIDEENYKYTDQCYTEFLKGQPYYYEYKTASVIDIFCVLDKQYVPFLFQAILLRLGMSSLEAL